MKPTNKQKETYFSNIACNLVRDMKKRVDAFIESYNEMMFGKKFFLEIEVDNALRDLIYFRDKFKIHMNLCIANGIHKDSFAYRHCSGFYLKELEEIEFKSFISIIQLADSYFPLKEEIRIKINKQLNEIAKEVMDEIIEEEKS